MGQPSESSPSLQQGLDADGEAAHAQERPLAHYIVISVVLVLLVEIDGLTFTMVSPALSGIAAAFHTTHVAWVLTAVTLVSAVTVALCGKLGDVFGKKRVALGCTAVFIAGSVISAAAPSFGVLVAGRAMQGVGIVTVVVVYGLVRDLLPKRMVPVVLGFVGTGMGSSMVIGPIMGGYLIDAFGFRGVFWFQFVYLLVVGVLVMLLVPETPVRHRVRLDWWGATLLGVGALALLLGLGNVGTAGWLAPGTLLGVIGGIALLAVWVAYERRPAEPLIDLDLLKQRNVAATLLASFVLRFAIMGNSMLLAMFVMTPSSAGYGFGSTALGVAKFASVTGVAALIAGPLAGVLAKRTRPEVPLVVGAAALMVGSTMLALLHGTATEVMFAQSIFGLAVGACSAALPNMIVQSVPATAQGVSGGMLTLSGSLGSSIGSQVLAVVLLIPAVRYVDGRVVYGESGFTTAFLVMAAAGLVAVVAALSIGATRRLQSAAVSQQSGARHR